MTAGDASDGTGLECVIAGASYCGVFSCDEMVLWDNGRRSGPGGTGPGVVYEQIEGPRVET